jgi:tight adherence protein B
VGVIGAFLLAVCATALGVVGLVRLARGLSVLPPRVTAARPRDTARIRQVAVAIGVGLVTLLVTRWPAAGLAAAVIVTAWPRVFGGAAAGRRALRKVEAIAIWTESLRDASSAAAGLEQAIPATVPAAPEVLRRPVRDLTARLDGRVPLPEALVIFADDLDDSSADMVVAALSLNARQRAGGLERILTALATSARAELEVRRRVELERRGLRRQAQRIAGAVIAFILLQAVLAPGWVAPYGTFAGQVVLTLLVGVFLAAFMRMRALAESRPPARFLTTADAVTEIASFKPRSFEATS